MDEFFQRLREIQKKERSLSGLSNVGENFYQDVFKYIDSLMEKIGNNPFSFESYLLRDTQRIVAEIRERREHKITNSAIMNVQRSHQLFKDIKEDKATSLPRNSTSEERTLYRELFDSLAQHRKGINYPISSSTVKNRKVTPPIKTSETESLSEKKTKSGPVLKVEEPSSNVKNRVKERIYKEFGEEPFKQADSKETPFKDLKKDRISQKNKIEDLEQSNINPTDENISTEVLMITDELPSIMGVDRKIYGPFLPGDVITMPEPNARILLKKEKGKLIQRYK